MSISPGWFFFVGECMTRSYDLGGFTKYSDLPPCFHVALATKHASPTIVTILSIMKICFWYPTFSSDAEYCRMIFVLEIF